MSFRLAIIKDPVNPHRCGMSTESTSGCVFMSLVVASPATTGLSRLSIIPLTVSAEYYNELVSGISVKN